VRLDLDEIHSPFGVVVPGNAFCLWSRPCGLDRDCDVLVNSLLLEAAVVVVVVALARCC
jgi:hypothetical protein